MIRRLLLVITLACAAWGQSSSPSISPLVANTSGDSSHMNSGIDMVSPGAISPSVATNDRGIPGLPPLPSGKVTLIGGTIHSVDLVRDKMVLQVFAGRRMTVLFDDRTRMFRGGVGASLGDLQKGDRVYVDTTLDGRDIFARTIRVAGSVPAGQSSGQVVRYNSSTRELTLRDSLSPEPVAMRIAADAKIVNGDRTVTVAELKPGALVSLNFDPGSGKTPTVRQISILASPGTTFVFVGTVEHIDLRRGLLVIVDPRDNKNYDLYFDPDRRNETTRTLRQGAKVTVEASFDGKRYESRSITVNGATTE